MWILGSQGQRSKVTGYFVKKNWNFMFFSISRKWFKVSSWNLVYMLVPMGSDYLGKLGVMGQRSGGQRSRSTPQNITTFLKMQYAWSFVFFFNLMYGMYYPIYIFGEVSCQKVKGQRSSESAKLHFFLHISKVTQGIIMKLTYLCMFYLTVILFGTVRSKVKGQV